MGSFPPPVFGKSKEGRDWLWGFVERRNISRVVSLEGSTTSTSNLNRVQPPRFSLPIFLIALVLFSDSQRIKRPTRGERGFVSSLPPSGQPHCWVQRGFIIGLRCWDNSRREEESGILDENWLKTNKFQSLGVICSRSTGCSVLFRDTDDEFRNSKFQALQCVLWRNLYF